MDVITVSQRAGLDEFPFLRAYSFDARNGCSKPALRGRQQGLGLLELLIVLAIVSIMASIALPGLDELVSQQRSEAAARKLHRALVMARSAAVTRHEMVTLCRTADGRKCGGSWSQRIALFLDGDGDRQANEPDQVLSVVDMGGSETHISWRSFGNRQYLQFLPVGSTNNQNGNFTLCPSSGDMRHARQLVISRTGRIRHARDSDGDGFVENSRGKPIQC